MARQTGAAPTADLSLSSLVILAGVHKQFVDFGKRKYQSLRHVIDYELVPAGVTKVSALTIQLQGAVNPSSVASGVSDSPDGDGVFTPGGADLQEGSTPADGKIAFGDFSCLIDGNVVNVDADAVGVVFSAVHKVALDKFGAINIYVDVNSNVVSRIRDGGAQTDELTHPSARIAMTEARDASLFTPAADEILIGTILIGADGTQWVANTDDLTNASDLDTATFFNELSPFNLLDSHALSGDEIAHQRGTYNIDKNVYAPYMRLAIVSLTGDAIVAVQDFIQVVEG